VGASLRPRENCRTLPRHSLGFNDASTEFLLHLQREGVSILRFPELSTNRPPIDDAAASNDWDRMRYL